MFDFILNGNYLKLIFLPIFILLVTVYLKSYYKTASKKGQHLIDLKNRRDQILLIGIGGLFLSLMGYIIELSSFGKNSLFLGSNPFLILILRTDSAEQNFLLQEMISGILRGSSFVLFGLGMVIIAAIFWSMLQRKINKIILNN